MKAINTILMFIILLNGPGMLLANNIPTSKDVKRELNKLMKDLDNYKEQKAPETKKNMYPKELFEFIKKVFTEILNFIYKYRYPILIILFIGLIIFMFFSFRKPKPDIGQINPPFQEGQKKYFEELDQLSFNELHHRAIEFSKTNKYNQAIIYLHIASIKFLLDSLIIEKDIEYTNNDIKKLLKDRTKLVESFSKIAICAEIAGFSDSVIKIEEFNHVNIFFERDFLKTK